MAYGLRIINDNSELLIDSDYVNPTFVQKLEFNSTPTSTETGIYSGVIDNLHAGYYKREYTTPFATLSSGNYMVLWKIPDNGNVDVWYNFPTSTMDVNRTLTCEVYANSTGAALTYTLPTAYIFAVDVGSMSTLSSSAPAIRLYNGSEQLTFNSSFTQLIPYNFSDNFSFPIITTTSNISISSPTNGIYLLPKAYAIYQIDASNEPGIYYTVLYDGVFKRVGSTVSCKLISSYWKSTAGSTILNNITYGTEGTKSIMVADGDLYQGSNGSVVIPTNPTYTLSANSANVNETTNKTITVTLTTTNVTNGTLVYYTITGISPQDLTSGTLDGSFNIQNGTASATFTVATDGLSETTETFLLSLIGISQNVSINILDTSRSPYGWSAPSATSVNEGSSIYLDFNGLYNDATYPITFALTGPAVPLSGQSQEQIFGYPDFTVTYTIPAGASYTRVTVNARDDLWPEGPERWRVVATVAGIGDFYSADITINDTTTSSITTADNYIVGADNNVTINVIGGLGKTVNLYSIDNTVIDVKAGSPTSWYVNSNNFTASTIYRAKKLDPGTYGFIGLWLRNGTELLTLKQITVSPTSYALTPGNSSVNEGSPITFVATGNGISDGTYYWTVTNSTDFATSSGSFTITNNTGTFTVTPTADNTTEGSETFTASLRVGSTSGTIVATSSTVTINDTSKVAEEYTMDVSSQFTTEGQVVRITFISSLDYAHPVFWTWEGVDLGSPYAALSLADISSMRYFDPETNISGGSTYTQITKSDRGTFSFPTSGLKTSNLQYALEFTINNDGVTEPAEYAQVYLRPEGGYTGSIKAAQGFFVQDPVATYSISPNVTSINEGGTLIWNITTTNVPNGTVLYWLDIGTNTNADYNDNVYGGSVTINNNTGTVTRVVKADAGPYEGPETAKLALYNNSSYSTLLAQYGSTVTINDTSTNVSESLTISPTSVAFPNTVTVSITGGVPNTIARYSLDNTSYAGSVTLDANGNYTNPNAGPGEAVGTHTLYVKFDATNNTRQASWTVTPAASTYSFSRNISIANEGATITYNATTTNVANGTTLYWRNLGSTTSSDFTSSINQGSFTINNNTGSFTLTLTNDQFTEGEETVYVFFYSDSGYATMIGYTGQTTVNDTSTTPVSYPAAGTLLSQYCGTGANIYTRYGNYADGSGGSYVQVIETNASYCGYVAPAGPPEWRFHRTVGSITWTVPAGRTSIIAIVIAGGAGGRSQTGGGGGGGAGGVQYIDPVAVTPGQVLTLTVGAGGGSNTNGSQSSITGTGVSIVAGGGTTGIASTSSNGGNMGSGNFGGGIGGTGAPNAGGGGGGIGYVDQANGYSATAGIGGDGGASFPLFEGTPPGPFNVCGGGGGAALNEAGQGGFASGGQGAGPAGTGTNNGGAAVDHGGGGGGAKSGGTGGSGFRGMIAWYG